MTLTHTFKNRPRNGKSVKDKSMGLKLLLICGLVVLMAVPALFISKISYERSDRADEVTRDVSQRYGGAQTVMGPVLVAPYINFGEFDSYGKRSLGRGEYVVFPDTGVVDIGDMQSAQKKLSLYRVMTYQADVKTSAGFTLPSPASVLSGNIDWSQARILVGLSNMQGLRDDVYLNMPDGSQRKFTPSLSQSFDPISVRGESYSDFDRVYDSVVKASRGLQYMSVSVGDLLSAQPIGDAQPSELTRQLSVSSVLRLSGAQSLSIAPFAQSSKASIISDWPHPGFTGSFAPTQREITDQGFTASWNVPLLARGLANEGPAHIVNFGKLTHDTIKVSFVQTLGPYQTVNRALKYAVLFIGLVFLAYFLFEIMIGVRVHPAQYVLIGLAQSIFYLMLLAFAEHIGFTLAFIISASATVAVTSGYAGAVFGARRYAQRAAMVFASVYGLLFVLMKIEDFALMVGALTSFVAISATMYLTRDMDWYGLSERVVTREAKPATE